MTNLDNVKPYLEEYAELRKEKKGIEDRLKHLDSTVRPMLDGLGAVMVAGFMFELKVNKGRRTLDKAALIADGIDVENYYRVGTPFTSLFIKEVATA